MRHTYRPLSPLAFVGALALASAAVLSGTATPALAAASGVTTIDFEDSTTGTWIANGAPTLTYVDDSGTNGTKVLSVADRDATHVGLQSPASAFDAGVEYTFSADVLLSEAAGVHFIAYDDASADIYNWVGNVTVPAGTWTTVTGNFTFDAASIATAKAFLEVSTTADYLVDNLTVSAAPAGTECVPGTATVVAYDFDAATAPWTARGAQNVAITTEARSGAGALIVTGRSATWHGPQIDVTTTLVAGTYQITGYAKLPADATGTAQVNLGVNEPGATNEYPWLGNRVSVDGTEWVQVGGTYTVKPDEPPAIVYLESDSATADILFDDVTITHEVACDEGPAAGTVAISTGFEDGLDGWELRDPGVAGGAVSLSTDQAHGGAQSAQVSERASQGHGLRFDVTEALVAGATYELSAWVRFADGQATDDVWLSMQNNNGTATTFATLKQFTGMSNTEWVKVTGQFTMPTTDQAYLYFETAWQAEDVAGNTSTFFVDDIVVSVPEPAVVQDLTPIKDTMDVPVGVAIDSRETTGSGATMVTKHFDQVTAENFMKPEAWYNDAQEFSPSPEIDALMDFAVANDLKVYGHVLVWHSQTPDWFFKDGDRWLTNSSPDQQILKDRMREHIANVAQYLSDNWGEFGAGNPVYAFDVVNEVIDDSAAYADGMRRSHWYDILGESFVDLAFEYADQAFNGDFAAESAAHPVTLFINDYNTEQAGKRGRYLGLVDRLIDRGAPIDGVGHQFHLSLSMPVESLAAALDEGVATGLIQAVTEFDVTTGVPETAAKFIDQGYYYRDAFNIFRSHEDNMFSVTVWGLNDARSWRDASGGPLVFDDDYSAKPAYYGIVTGHSDEAPLPDRLRTANVFAGDVVLDSKAIGNATWDRLPLLAIDDKAKFQLRWSPGYLTAYVSVVDATGQANDAVELQVGDASYVVGRDGTAEVDAVVSDSAGGYTVVARIPFEGTAAEGDTVQFDVRTIDGDSHAGWNSEGVLGTLTLVEPISYLAVPQAVAAPIIDGARDEAWEGASVAVTGKTTSGEPAAVGTFATLWRDNMIYVYAHIVDADVDITGSDPWTQDSVEIYVDPGNVKNGSYRYDDTQIRINAENVQSFGTGDEAFQANRVQSATKRVADGYIVEAAISLLEDGGAGTFQGVDFQVNDATAGARDGIANWADPTGAGYQSTAHWGVAELVSALPGDGDGDGDNPGTDNPGSNNPGADGGPGDGDGTDVAPDGSALTDANRGAITVPATAVPGQVITLGFGQAHNGSALDVWMFSTPQQIASIVVVDGVATVTIPADITLGEHRIAVYGEAGELIGWDNITIVAAAPDDSLSATGADVLWTAGLAILLVGAGGALVLRRRHREPAAVGIKGRD